MVMFYDLKNQSVIQSGISWWQ